jgi:gliding motility-associated-like protein
LAALYPNFETLLMYDRLLMNKRWLFYFLTLVFTTQLHSQASFFQFNYPGPDTIAAGTSCNAILQGAMGTPMVTSTSGATIILSQFNAAATGFGLSSPLAANTTYTIHWNVADNQGHTFTFTFPIRIQDQTPPTINTAGLVSPVSYGSIAQVPTAPLLSATDFCTPSANIIIQYEELGTPPLCSGGTMTRTWTAIDAAGNSAVFTQTINIATDILPPQITSFPTSTFQSCSQNLTPTWQMWLSAQMSAFQATDASGAPILTNNAAAQYPFACAQNVVVTFTATDLCGLATTANANFTTNDFVKPVIIQDARDSIVYCNTANNHIAALSHWINQHAKARASDACTPDTALVWFMEFNGNPVDSATVVAAFQQSMLQGCQTKTVGNQVVAKVRGLIDLNFYVKDRCNNIEHLGMASFAAVDTTKPVLTQPSSATQDCLGGAGNANAIRNWVIASGNAIATDYCSSSYWSNFYTYRLSSGAFGSGDRNNGPYPIAPNDSCTWHFDATFFATDDCGNADSITVRYQMNDQTAPVFTAIPVLDTLPCGLSVPNTYAIPVIDACTGTVLPTFTSTLLSTPCPGTTIYRINWTATDKCGNTSTAVSQVVLLDKTGPQFTTVPADYTVRCDQFLLPPAATLGVNLFATDLCGSVASLTTDTTNTRSTDSTSCAFNQYTVHRFFIATDGCGNKNTATQTITVIDTIGPAFTGFLDSLVNCSAIADPLITNFPLPVARDLCNSRYYPLVSVDRNVTAGACADNYDLKLRWSATDACGNTSEFTQTVRARDTIAPTLVGIPANITVDCTAIPAPPIDGVTLISADNCDETVTIILNETEIRVPDSTDCDHYSYELKREWIASDNCGNIKTYTQLIAVRDSLAPKIVCHPNVIIPNLPGSCDAMTNIPIPVAIYDECSSTKYQAALTQTKPIVNTSGLPNNTAVVDTLEYLLSAPNFSDTDPASSMATLVITMEKVDAEQADEHFRVFGENGDLLGITSPTSAQCGDGVTTINIPNAKLNTWLMDGNITLTLAPNGTGGNAINPICAGAGTVKIDLTYAYVKPNIPVTVVYQLNNGASLPFPPTSNILLPGGINSVTYTASDCFSNQASCALQIRILDVEGPSFTAPDTIIAYAHALDCNATVQIKAPTLFDDNCGLSGQFQQLSQVTPVTFAPDPNAGNIPAKIVQIFAGVPAHNYQTAQLQFRFLGDNAEPGEFFTLYSENGSVIGNTSLINQDSQCIAWHETKFQLNTDSLRVWARDGQVSFSAEANNDAGSFTEFIHPCGPLNLNGQDLVSKYQMGISYPFADFKYAVRSANGDTISQGAVPGLFQLDTIATGAYSIRYALSDPSGNTSLRNSVLKVIDTIAPIALCKNSLVPIDIGLSGAFTLSPSQIDNQSRDNCAIVSMSLSQTQFSCIQSGNNFPVSLTVFDAAGLQSTCQAQIQIQPSGISPSYLSGACVNQALQLFANPLNDPNQTFSYQWQGPNLFSSAIQNPMIPLATTANEGTYTVTATNINGCSMTATVFVALIGQPNTPTITKDKPAYCVGESVTLSTQAFGGNTAQYQWYQGAPGSGILIGTSNTPQWIVQNTNAGMANYYVQVLVNNCASLPSAATSVIVNAYPIASAAQSQIMICEGNPITLLANNQGIGFSYQWTGPNFQSTSQQALITNSGSSTHAGNYQLVVTLNGCASAPVQVQVQVQARPQQPVISTNSPLCIGSQLQIQTTATGVDAYHWVSPLQDTIVTTTASYTNTSAQLPLTGNWSLFVMKNGCSSSPSSGVPVVIEAYPNVSAEANSPVCLSSVLSLKATSTPANVSFQWTGPSGFATVVQNPITNPIGGTYIVTASTQLAMCANTDTIEVVSVVNPIITALSSNAPLCATGTNDAQLFSIVFPSSGNYTYQWNGPNGFVSTNANPMIPNLTAANAGQYLLAVTDQFGCASQIGSTTLLTTNAPVTPIITPVQAMCTGGNLEMIIQNAAAYQGSNVTYIWHAPGNIVVSTPNPSYQKMNTTTADAGLYWVEVRIGNCVSLPSPQINIVISPVPPTPVINANTPLCEGDTLKLGTTISTGTYTWNWSGPSGLLQPVSNPFIPQVISNLHAGPYQVSYILNGCSSPLSDVLLVDVKPRPTKPAVLAGTSACVSDSAAVLNLQISPNTATPSASYLWFDGFSNQPVGMMNFTLNQSIDSLYLFGPGMHQFYVVAQLDGCSSLASNQVSVQFDTIPNQSAFAGTDLTACNQAPIQLEADAPTIGSGNWSQSSSQILTMNTPNQNETSVLGALPNQVYQFVWTLNNGGCIAYSKDTVFVRVSEFEFAQSEAFIDSCFVFQAQLSAQVPISGAQAYWSQSNNQAATGVQILEPTNPNTFINSIEPGNTYFFFWNIPDLGCGPSVDTTILRSIGSQAYAGTDKTVCNQDSCYGLAATPLASFESGTWKSPNPDLYFSAPYQAQTTVCNLSPGVNILIWETNDGKCGDRSIDTLNLRFEFQPILNPDTIKVLFGEQSEFDVHFNDVLPDETNESTLTYPLFGTLLRKDQGTYIYKPDIGRIGQDLFSYQVCNVYCADTCPTTVVLLDVLAPTNCAIPTLFTPNGDKINDIFLIPCFENDGYLDNEVLIFNSNGDRVFYAAPYRNDWQGLGHDGKELGAGTYFYIVKYNGDSEEKSGFLELRR